MTLLTIANLFLVVIVGGLLFFSIIRQIPALPEKRRSLVIIITNIFGVGLVIYLTSISAGTLAPSEPFLLRLILFLLALFLIMGIISLVGLSVIWTLVLFIIVPSNIRKVLAILIILMTSILFLSVMNAYFQWDWNFPDIFGFVSGLLALSFLLFDRYLANPQPPSPPSRKKGKGTKTA